MHRLHSVTGEFLDRPTERAFRASVLPEVQRDSRLTLTVATLLTFLFIFSDYAFVGSAWPFPLLLAMRIAVALVCAGLAVYLYRSDALLDSAWIYSIAPVMVASAVFIVAAYRPQTLPTQLTAVIIVIMACYLFAPNVMRGMLASSAYLSVGFLLSAWYWADTTPGLLIAFAILLILTNIVGYFAARRVARLQRRQFALLMEERRSKERLEAEVVRREALERQLRDLAQTDGLTGLSNRRHLIGTAHAALETARGRGAPLSLCMIDLDDFKRINDSWGHGVGDTVLMAVAKACTQVFGGDALIGRFGGEEFVAALPGLDLAAATDAAEQLRAEVAGLSFEEAPQTLRVTVTVGVATVRLDEVELAPAIARADAALYEGKWRGRNTVVADSET